MDFNIIHLWSGMNHLVRAVVVVLTVQALFSIYVLIDRMILLVSSQARSRKFAAEAGAKLERGEYQAVLEIAKKHDKSHLAAFISVGVSTFLKHVERRGREKAADFVKRALERKGENLSESLNRGLTVLASTGSTAPFVGLLGTVLGILNAFKLIGEEASGGMGTIGPAIAEALIVTGYGLTVAIPAVLAFNFLSGRIAHYEAGLANAGSELTDQLEAGASLSSPPEAEALSTSDEAIPAPA